VEPEQLEGLVSPFVGEELSRLAYHVQEHRAIVNLGTFKGKSACYLAAGAARGLGAHVYAVDAWDLPGNVSGRYHYTAAYKECVKQVASTGLKNISLVQAQSADIGWARHLEVGLLFIDASHLYEDVKADYLAWRDLLSPGAYVVFDDYKTAKNPGVTKLIRELVLREEGLHDWWFGIAPLAVAIWN